MSQEKKYDVFISYSRKDSTIADEICEAFGRVGITYFIDRKGIGGGNEFPLELATSILNSQVFLLLGSKNSYESKYTNAEIHFAFKKKEQKSILPYILDDTPMPLEIDFILSTINWRKYQEHPINTILVDDVLKLLGRERPTELVRKDANIEQAKREALLDGEFQVGELKYKASENSGGVSVCGLINEGASEIHIPSQIQYGNYTYDVDCIGDSAFYQRSSLTSITIPKSVTCIGERAFSGCSGLNSIIVEKGNDTYDSRENSNAIIETASNTLIAGCKNTIIPHSVTSIGNRAFGGCSSLTSITIPNSVTSIGNRAFFDCSDLTSITIPNSVTSIGYYAFAYCSGLTSIIVESGNKTYDSRENCNAIIETASNTLIAGCKNTQIPHSVTSIGKNAFYGCKGLTSITIPNSVTSIGEGAFRFCSDLTSITIPNSVTSIGEEAFSWCSGLTSIIIPNSVTSIGEEAFNGCKGMTSITILNSVTSIGNRAFSDCYGLTSITIPNSVTSIGGLAFSGCESLTSIVVEKGNKMFDSRENCNAIIETASNTLIAGCKNTIIPNSVTSIGCYAFGHCLSLTSITIPNSVTSIGYYAFAYCLSLTSISIPNSVTSIGKGAFWECSGLTSITIPNSVTSIEEGAFSNCSNLTSITIPNSLRSIRKEAFYGCKGLTSITIPNSVKSIREEAFYGCKGLTSIIIPNSVTSIGNGAFRWCDALKSVKIPKTLTDIGYDAFPKHTQVIRE